MKWTAICLFILLPPAIFAQRNDKSLFELSATQFLLGTQVEILLMSPSVEKGEKACNIAFQEIERIENRLSSHLPESEISQLNREADRGPVKVSEETFALIQRAQNFAQKFDGYFDISIGPLSELWGFNSDQKIALPDQKRLLEILPLVNYQNIILNQQDTTVFLAKKGMRLDLGGIAKGYAIDRAAQVLREQTMQNFLINAGGDIYVSGVKSQQRQWIIGIKHPRQANALLAKFELKDYAVATSGDYERFAMINGKRYHHILNPRTGYPAQLSQSVTVLAPTAEQADAWATYLFILGYDGYKQKYPEPPVQALFVDVWGTIHFDPSFIKHYALKLLR